MILKTAPAVFAVGGHYQIMVEVERESLFFVRVLDTCYYDESNGVMNSLNSIHRVSVPCAALEEAREYTVCVRPLRERKPYFTETEELREQTFPFRPVPSAGPVRLYHIADAHNRIDEPVQAARAFGDIDLLVLNGDLIEHSGDPEKFSNIYQLCSRLTDGRLPVVFSRGNHDMRGNFAERFADYTPNHLGNTYYTFRLGSVWGLVLDCGEDKNDPRPEYGHTIACHGFRERQSAFLASVIARAEEEYLAEGVSTRLVIAHCPFTRRFEEPFDIEHDIYREWARLLREHVHPHLMLCGHTHVHGVFYPGEEGDLHAQPCPLVVGAEPREDCYIGCGVTLADTYTAACFTDSLGGRGEDVRFEK